jgi:hypothetical protein
MKARLGDILEADFRETEHVQGDKLLYLGDCVFDFITYVDEYSKHFAAAMLRTLQRIQDGTNFDFIQASEENHLEYLTMVNMPFLKDRLEWGTSIRGAWFDHGKEIEVGNRFDDTVFKMEFSQYIKELLEWYNDPVKVIIEDV